MSISLALPTERSALMHNRILQLDGLRAIAICTVLAAHVLQLPLGWVGVDIFFLLSGFLITGILMARKRSGGGDFSYFYRRRIFRILPAYAVSVVARGISVRLVVLRALAALCVLRHEPAASVVAEAWHYPEPLVAGRRRTVLSALAARDSVGIRDPAAAHRPGGYRPYPAP